MGRLDIYILAAFPVIIEGIKKFLETKDFINVSGYSYDIDEILKDIRQWLRIGKQRPDILVIDDSFFYKVDYDSVLNRLPASFQSVKIIVYTGSTDAAYLKKLVGLGVSGILHKASSGEHGEKFIEALKLVSIGNVYFDNIITSVILKDETLKEISDHHVKQFSEREKDVLLLIAEGNKNKEISEKLFISTGTVDVHKSHLIKKLNLRSTTELAVFAVSHKDKIKILVETN